MEIISSIPLGQFRSSVPAVLPHSFLHPGSLAEHGEVRSPWLRVRTIKQQPKDQCVDVILPPANEKKKPLSHLKPRHYLPFIPYHRTPCSEYKLEALDWEGLIAAWGQAEHWVVAGNFTVHHLFLLGFIPLSPFQYNY